MPKRDNMILCFKNYGKQMEVPFVVYADFECILEDIDISSDARFGRNSIYVKKHVPCAYSFYVKCRFNNNLDKFVKYVGVGSGDDVAKHFANSISDVCRNLYQNHLEPIIDMITLTPLEEEQFENSTSCYICGKGFSLENYKVRDHCHVSGKYRGSSHNSCNLNFQVPTFIPIFFHNFSGYDCHLLIKDLVKVEGTTNLIPLNKELYISVSHTIQVYEDDNSFHKKNHKVEMRFLDSYRFMADSLDSLARNLSDNDMCSIRAHFPQDNKFNLMRRKGVFPYEYINSFQKLQEVQLPPIEAFSSVLNNSKCSESDYSHARSVWDTFSCDTLSDFMELYLKTDVLLLADIFENFRSICMRIYNLDPCHYFTAPGLSWDAMLKTTKIELELLIDLEMYMFFKQGIRGGLTQCSKRYSKANNKYMDNYDPSKPSEYLMYYDANNLYGWAMSQDLPYGDFEWVEDFNHLLNPNSIPEDSLIGYVYEVDLDYPQNLHDTHNDLPFCPENRVIGNTRQKKLIADLSNKRNYIIHYKVLQQCITNGLILKKVHRILSFKQSPWLKKYIDLNTMYRSNATNTFEKKFFKLLNNAVYGKTMENIDKRKDVKLVSKWETSNRRRLGAEALIAKPNFQSISRFSDSLWAVQMGRVNVNYDKPMYLGFCVLELSKWKMYNFHYEYMKPKFDERLSLNYMDTDSFIYSIQSEDFYADIKNDIPAMFDTSEYPENNIFNFPRLNKKVLGLMKDENHGTIMKEFVGLGPKLYSFTVEDGREVKKAKGVKNCVVAQYSINNYRQCLFRREVNSDFMYTFTSKLHQILTTKSLKVTLSPVDTKRKIREDNIQTYAWYHYAIEELNNV